MPPDNQANYTNLKDRFDSLRDWTEKLQASVTDNKVAIGKQETAGEKLEIAFGILQKEQLNLIKQVSNMAGKMAVWGALGGILVGAVFKLLAQ